jgi:hypothetical protein
MTTSTRERALGGDRHHRNPRPASIGTGGRLRSESQADFVGMRSGCPDDMEVEVKPGVPLVAKTVADLRALNAWSPDWALIVPYERQRPESVVEVELA